MKLIINDGDNKIKYNQIQYTLEKMFNIFLTNTIKQYISQNKNISLNNNILKSINLNNIILNIIDFIIKEKIFRWKNNYYDIYNLLLETNINNGNIINHDKIVTNAINDFFKKNTIKELEVIDLYRLTYKDPQDESEVYGLIFTSINDIKNIKEHIIKNIEEFSELFCSKTIFNISNKEVLDLELFDFNIKSIANSKDTIIKFLEE